MSGYAEKRRQGQMRSAETVDGGQRRRHVRWWYPSVRAANPPHLPASSSRSLFEAALHNHSQSRHLTDHEGTAVEGTACAGGPLRSPRKVPTWPGSAGCWLGRAAVELWPRTALHRTPFQCAERHELAMPRYLKQANSAMVFRLPQHTRHTRTRLDAAPS